MENYAFVWNAATRKKLRLGLEGLKGYDYENAEREEAASGNTTAYSVISKAFQARIASYALNVPVPEIKKLPIREYNEITTEVFVFLSNGSGGTDESGKSTDGSRYDARSTEESNIGTDEARRS